MIKYIIVIIEILKEKYSIYAHEQRFDTEEKCLGHLMSIRWEGGVPTCPRCGNRHMNSYIQKRKVYKCSSCSKQFSILQGTLFENSKLPLKVWYTALYLFTTKKRGLSSIQLSKWIGVKQQTAWFMLQRIREAMKNENENVLSGIVEVDEAIVAPLVKLDKRLQYAQFIHEKNQNITHGLSRQKRLKMGIKLKKGRKKGSDKATLKKKELERGGKPYNSHSTDRVPFEKGAVILGMIEPGGRLVMKKLGNNWKSVNKHNIYPLLKKHITENSTLISDQLGIYEETAKIFNQHLAVNHTKGYVIDGISTNNIENAWKHLKVLVRNYTHISYHHFDGYLHETTYKWNRKDESERILFDDFMKYTAHKRVTRRELTERSKKIAA